MIRATIVIPCFNEGARLDVKRFIEFAFEHPGINLLFVDDGSRDATGSRLREIERHHPDTVRLMSLECNVGKAEAVRRGVLAAIDLGAPYVGYWDADLATPLELVTQFLAVFHRFADLDVVIGSRVKLLGRSIDRRWQRHLLGRCFATCASLVLGLPVYDTQCGAKLFRVSSLTRFLFDRPFGSRWIFDVELLARLARLRSRFGLSPVQEVVYELPLDVWREVPGSKLRARDFLRAAWELVSIWRRYRAENIEPLPSGAEFEPVPLVSAAVPMPPPAGPERLVSGRRAA